MKAYSLMPLGIQSKLLEQPQSSCSGWLHVKWITNSVWLPKTCCLGSNPPALLSVAISIWYVVLPVLSDYNAQDFWKKKNKKILKPQIICNFYSFAPLLNKTALQDPCLHWVGVIHLICWAGSLCFQLSVTELELGTLSTSLNQYLNETGLGSIPGFTYWT